MIQDLTYNEIKKAPDKIQYLWICYIGKFHIGCSFYLEIIKKYPEYFKHKK